MILVLDSHFHVDLGNVRDPYIVVAFEGAIGGERDLLSKSRTMRGSRSSPWPSVSSRTPQENVHSGFMSQIWNVPPL